MTKPYPSYKDSDVASLGRLPEHWEVKPLKALASTNDEAIAENTDANFEIEYVDIGSVTLESGIQKTEAFLFKDAPSRARRLVRDGDILVSTVRTYLKAIAPIKKPAPNVIVSTGFAVIRPKANFSSDFARYALQSSVFVDEIIARSTGVSYPAINTSDMIRICLPSPPIAEQQSIAAFLDHETAKIDALVEEQRRLIELLKEKRQAVISHAVTKGLNPNTPMKDSGIEWLGEVPEHWEVRRLKNLITEPLTYGANEASDDDTPGNPRYVRITDIGADGGLREDTFRSLPQEVAQPYLLIEGDILLARSGATVGKSFIYRPNWGICCYAGYLIRARCNQKMVLPDYLHACCQSDFYWQHVGSEQIQATIQNVSAERYANLWVTIPSINEQTHIMRYLDETTRKIDQLISKAEEGSTLLQERRTALISAAVTGKIDVRNFTAKETEAA